MIQADYDKYIKEYDALDTRKKDIPFSEYLKIRMLEQIAIILKRHGERK